MNGVLDPLGLLFLQLILIVLSARSLGALFARWRQPAVVGEMVAGVLLGPSFLGRLAPRLAAEIFPADSLRTLQLLSQTGVCIFMFVIGMELDLPELRRLGRVALAVGSASIAFPYALGVVAALALYPALAAPGTPRPAFALFLGISMSVTAFPVLARILEDRGLVKTPLGTLAMACAAAGDVAAWTILGVVIAIASARGPAASLATLALLAIFTAAMLLLVRPRLPRWIGPKALDGAGPGRGVLAGVVAFLLASALATEAIGLHAVFGAFLAGIVIPRQGTLRSGLRVRLDEFGSALLVPAFFAFTGLRTQVALLDDSRGWLLAAAVVVIATAGKLGGTFMAARLAGVSGADAFALGALMNTRGLMELIVLNVGLDMGILSPRVFTMFVLMALATTVMTSPLLGLAERSSGGSGLKGG